ncbi:Uncharacterised protein [Legionella pneumophila]|nr:hypothetical protein [Legionella pneumophila subsp. pneumophila]CZH06185.1 Uncharacterised protein [Legionella pneumophila]CZH09312.1 Uncharacterised protein [Legionella pneumophila]CZH09766.1 Uncharacterised protein [Legionella pneumophila]CZH16352.1 Uncharacterised protein [Legionella pneumophila]
MGIRFFHSFKIFDLIFRFSHYYGKQRTLGKLLQSFLLLDEPDGFLGWFLKLGHPLLKR